MKSCSVFYAVSPAILSRLAEALTWEKLEPNTSKINLTQFAPKEGLAVYLKPIGGEREREGVASVQTLACCINFVFAAVVSEGQAIDKVYIIQEGKCMATAKVPGATKSFEVS